MVHQQDPDQHEVCSVHHRFVTMTMWQCGLECVYSVSFQEGSEQRFLQSNTGTSNNGVPPRTSDCNAGACSLRMWSFFQNSLYITVKLNKNLWQVRLSFRANITIKASVRRPGHPTDYHTSLACSLTGFSGCSASENVSGHVSPVAPNKAALGASPHSVQNKGSYCKVTSVWVII